MNRIKAIILISIVFLACFVLGTDTAQAGFGISPPYVKTISPIFPGSHFEQKVVLLRSSADEDLMAEITIMAPEVESWISIKDGEEFILPSGKYQVPMIVQVDVPEDAEIGDYKGYIAIKIVPKDGASSGVAIALGARVDIDLTVTNEPFLDYQIKGITIPNFEELKAPWTWDIFSYFFYKLHVNIKIQNKGNVEIAPTKVMLEVYDITEKKLLETGTDSKIEKAQPFKTSTLQADFKTKLEPGNYWGVVKVFKDNEIVEKDKLAFSVGKYGALGERYPIGFWPWAMLISICLVILIIIAFLIKVRSWRLFIKIVYIISWPFRYLWKKILKIKNNIKRKFWRYMHNKASKYQQVEKSIENLDEE